MDLSNLPVEDGFRLRGVQVTRVETFVDAAFAFSLTLLVIFFNELPDTVAELRDALRRVPTFAVCFVLLAMFWAAHNRWSRRFGLDDTRSTVLSLSLVLVVLVFVYPLRMVTSSALSLLTRGWVPNELGGLGDDWLLDLQTVFMVYALGFGLMAWITWQLNAHALQRGEALGLDALERYDTASEIGIHRIMTAAAFASVALSAALLAWPPSRAWYPLVGGPMWAYAVMGVAIGVYAARRRGRRTTRLEATA